MLNTSNIRMQQIGVLIIVFLVSVNISFVLYTNKLNFGSDQKSDQPSFTVAENEVVETVTTNDDAQQPANTSNTEKYSMPGVKNSKHSYGVYVVREGDSLYWIADRYDSSIDELVKLNGLNNTNIHPDQALVVPLRTLREYPVGVSLTDKEVQWIAQMIHAEARGEPYIGQVAVGSVIINRLKSKEFPNTVHDVLFQRNAFQPIRNGTFYHPASEMAYRAALEALSGHDPTNGAVFFFNPRISNDRFMHARPAVVTIGQHRFMY